MKKLLLSKILCLSFFIFSCEKDNDLQTNDNSVVSLKASSQDPLIIGKFDKENNFNFIVEEALLLNNWNNNLKKLSQIEANLNSLFVFKENGSHYIQARGSSYSSTILLNVTKNNQVYGGGVACTSKVCSNSPTGCVPKSDEKSCTKCSYPSDDCTKTVTSLSLFDGRL